MAVNSEKKDLTNEQDSSYILWQRLQEKAAEIKHGSFTCEIQIYNGIIKQVEITDIKARFRID